VRLANVAWSFLGLGVPILVAALTIPSLIERIGMERFGLLALAWGLIGFSGAFDLGIGRATTQALARLTGTGSLEQAPAILKTATTLSFGTGMIGAFILIAAVLAGAHTHINYSVELNTEVTIAAVLLAITIPIQSVSAMFRGVNEAFENFREISLVRIGLGVTNFLGPFYVAFYAVDLSVLVSTLLISRIIALLLFFRFAHACLESRLPPYLERAKPQASAEIARRLLVFGGWFSISSFISPMLVQADRFFIGALSSAANIAAYTIPYEVVTQSLIIVGAISSVAFPSLSALVHSNSSLAEIIFKRWLLRTAVVMLVASSLCALLMPVILPWWIGPKLPLDSVLVGQILCVGIFANSIGLMYFAFLHAHARADITAKIHLIELPLYLGCLYFMVSHFGVIGAALAWVGRVMLDTFFLFIAREHLRKKGARSERLNRCS
jgi:O-antigen/teichoic acid export membrane protein